MHRFTGILTILDEPSDLSPTGARGRRIVLTRAVAAEALDGLKGAPIHFTDDFEKHDLGNDRGYIEKAFLGDDNTIRVEGYLTCEPGVVASIRAAGELGMSWDADDCHVADIRDRKIWTITKMTFVGAAVVRRAAYGKSSFRLKDGI